jgi:hypothetical protein
MISFIGSRAFAVLALLATLACVSAFDRKPLSRRPKWMFAHFTSVSPL